MGDLVGGGLVVGVLVGGGGVGRGEGVLVGGGGYW